MHLILSHYTLGSWTLRPLFLCFLMCSCICSSSSAVYKDSTYFPCIQWWMSFTQDLCTRVNWTVTIHHEYILSLQSLVFCFIKIYINYLHYFFSGSITCKIPVFKALLFKLISLPFCIISGDVSDPNSFSWDSMCMCPHDKLIYWIFSIKTGTTD